MKANNFLICNTLFRHKLSHVTTWTAPFRASLIGPDGNPRRNPIRNQIDFIATKRQHRLFIKDSKSTSNIETNTDHKLVIMIFEIEWTKYKHKKKTTEKKADISKFHYEDNDPLDDVYLETSLMSQIK